jgi:signal transduction histidine kinase
LQGQDLAAGLREWSTAWARQSGIQLELDVQGQSRLPLETEQELFRIAQEALSNVARHSQAKIVEIHLEYGPETTCLTIHDNGQGFDPANPSEGIGLQSMQERASQLEGGRLDITSGPGQGTTIQVRCKG